MRALLIAALLGASGAYAASDPQAAHAAASCGSLGPGTGLSADGRGWVASMLPGRHEFRARGGAVRLPALGGDSGELDAGRPYSILVSGAPASALEWREPGSREWRPVDRTFLYPKQGAER